MDPLIEPMYFLSKNWGYSSNPYVSFPEGSILDVHSTKIRRVEALTPPLKWRNLLYLHIKIGWFLCTLEIRGNSSFETRVRSSQRFTEKRWWRFFGAEDKIGFFKLVEIFMGCSRRDSLMGGYYVAQILPDKSPNWAMPTCWSWWSQSWDGRDGMANFPPTKKWSEQFGSQQRWGFKGLEVLEVLAPRSWGIDLKLCPGQLVGFQGQLVDPQSPIQKSSLQT